MLSRQIKYKSTLYRQTQVGIKASLFSAGLLLLLINNPIASAATNQQNPELTTNAVQTPATDKQLPDKNDWVALNHQPAATSSFQNEPPAASSATQSAAQSNSQAGQSVASSITPNSVKTSRDGQSATGEWGQSQAEGNVHLKTSFDVASGWHWSTSPTPKAQQNPQKQHRSLTSRAKHTGQPQSAKNKPDSVTESATHNDQKATNSNRWVSNPKENRVVPPAEQPVLTDQLFSTQQSVSKHRQLSSDQSILPIYLVSKNVDQQKIKLKLPIRANKQATTPVQLTKVKQQKQYLNTAHFSTAAPHSSHGDNQLLVTIIAGLAVVLTSGLFLVWQQWIK